ncbi:uncharacterized protein EV420DRAFT_1578393, partial [Desarmillaria tabescens]
AIIQRMHFLRVTLYGPAWSLCEACVVPAVAVRGQPAWCGCVAAWLRGTQAWLVAWSKVYPYLRKDRSCGN